MDIPRAPDQESSASAFLIERYRPVSTAANLAASVAAVARLCAGQSGGSAVRYLLSIYLPAEETCFCIFQAPSSAAVRAVNDAGRFPFDRITEAVLMISEPQQHDRH